MIEEFALSCRHHLPKGHILLWPDEEVRTIFYLTNGIVRVYDIGDNGEERTLLLLAPDVILPTFIDMFSMQPYITKYYYDAFTDLDVYRVPRDQFIEKVDRNMDLLHTLVRNIIRTNGECIQHLAALEGKTADEKVRLTLRYANGIINRANIKRRLTHQEIADLAGLTRETVTTALARGAR